MQNISYLNIYNNILTVFVSIFHDRASYIHRAFLYVLQWRIKISFVQISLRHQVGESRRRNKEGLFGNCAHAGAYNSQCDSRENVTVVTLARIESPAVIRNRWERWATCKYASSLCDLNNDWLHTLKIRILIKNILNYNLEKLRLT